MYTKLMLKIARQVFAGISQTTNSDYENAMYNYYDDRNFVDFTLQQDKIAQMMIKRQYPRSQVKTLTNGNCYLRYIDTGVSIVILALLSKNGKLKREDVKDGNKILNMLFKQLINGKFIETSCNSKSLALLKKLKKIGLKQERAVNIKIKKVADFGDINGQGSWSHYVVTI